MKKPEHLQFLECCLDLSKISPDPSTKVGAVIVSPSGLFRGHGWNGFPDGIAATADRLSDRDVKNSLIVHAEMAAVLSCAKLGLPLQGCTLYLATRSAKTGRIWGGPPCTRCAVECIAAGIKTVVSFPFKDGPSRWRGDLENAKKILAEAGVDYRTVTNPHA